MENNQQLKLVETYQAIVDKLNEQTYDLTEENDKLMVTACKQHAKLLSVKEDIEQCYNMLINEHDTFLALIQAEAMLRIVLSNLKENSNANRESSD